MMRIITGTARGAKLIAPAGETTRPTSERAKEAIFSILNGLGSFSGMRVLDLFAGSGQLGLEALSRGADFALFADRDSAALSALETNIRHTHMEEKCTVRKSDAVSLLRTYEGEPFDLVFLDPPYAAGLLPGCLSLLRSRGLLKRESIVVCEAGKTADVFGGDAALASAFAVWREARYGVATVLFLTLQEEKR